MKSKLTTIYGGQFGSEGKGQIAAFIAQRQETHLAVRVGGPNAGHTFHYPNGRKEKVQSVPVAAMLGAAQGVIGPAGVILPDLLLEELERAYDVNNQAVHLLIDSNAAIITAAHMDAEVEMKKSIGSTGEGVGAATADKVMRRAPTVGSWDLLAWLKKKGHQAAISGVTVADDTAALLNRALLNGSSVMLEGTQGFGLSLHTGGYYPFCTSRECTPNALWAQTGANPLNADVVETIMVVRTFPIRVGGNSGPLANEISWDVLRKETGGYVTEPEITTVTKKIRRIARIDWPLLQRAVLQTRPSAVALSFFDYLHPDAAGISDASGLAREHWVTIREYEGKLGCPIKYLSTGLNVTMALRVTL